MMTRAPNRLGRALHYVASAYRFAFTKASDDRHLAFYDSLSHMAVRDQHIRETMDVDKVARLAITSAWFYSGTKLIADRVSARDARPLVKRRKGEELVDIKNHAFEILMERPNSLMTADFLLRYQTFWFYLLGNAYTFVSTPFFARGEPVELWPLPAKDMRPLPGTMRISRITGRPCIDYGYTVNGTETLLPGEHIVHVRNPNPFDYWNGLSFISAMMTGLKTDQAQAEYQENFYGKHNGVPTAIVSLPAETDPNQFETLKQQIKEQFDNGQMRAIIRAGDFSVQTIAQTFQQTDFINARKFNRELVNHVLGIPEGMLSGSQSGDSRLATEIAFTRNTVQPYLDLWAAEYQANIAPFYGDDNIVIVAPNIIPQDRTLQISEYTTYSQDRTINENRRILNLPPIDDLEDETLNKMLNAPVRLLPFISSNSYLSQEPGNGELPAEPETGDAVGFMNADNQAYEFTGKTTDLAQIAMHEELKRWRKVARAEAREGRNPAARRFTTKAIPSGIYINIVHNLAGATPDAVDAVFAQYLGGTGDIAQ